jgi:primase-polymerase (primpol)-like protein
MLWDYMQKKMIAQNYENYAKKEIITGKGGKDKEKKFHHEYTTMLYTPDGKQLLVATNTGNIKIFNPETAKAEDGTNQEAMSIVEGEGEKKSSLRIENMIISDDGTLLACSDN